METVQILFNVIVVVFIVATMFGAGLGTTLPALKAMLSNVKLWMLVLIANVVLVPLLGWGVAEVFNLAAPAAIALILMACSPGGPFGAKLGMIQKGEVVTGAALQVLLAAVGSVSFAIVANAVLGWADVGGGISLDVWQLVKTVAFLQLLPFAVGLFIRYTNEDEATAWQPTTLKISNLTLLVVLALMLLGNWQELIDLIGSRTLIAAVVFALAATALGYVVSAGPERTRTTTATLAPIRNAGPVFAAIGIAFNNDPEILAALAGILVIGNLVPVFIAGALGKRRTVAAPAPNVSESAAPASTLGGGS